MLDLDLDLDLNIGEASAGGSMDPLACRRESRPRGGRQSLAQVTTRACTLYP